MSKHTGGTSHWTSLEEWSSTLFVGAGGLLAILAALWAVEVFLDTDTSILRNVSGPAGMAVAFVGMLGLYPALADRTPRVAGAAALFAMAGIVGTVARVLAAGSQLLGLVAARPAWVEPFQLPFLIGIVLGFITFGVAVLRTDVFSPTIGVLLLVPGILFPVVLGTVIAFADGSFPYVIHVLHNGADAVALLGVGYLLRLNDVPIDRVKPTPDTTNG